MGPQGEPGMVLVSVIVLLERLCIADRPQVQRKFLYPVVNTLHPQMSMQPIAASVLPEVRNCFLKKDYRKNDNNNKNNKI